MFYDTKRRFIATLVRENLVIMALSRKNVVLRVS